MNRRLAIALIACAGAVADGPALAQTPPAPASASGAPASGGMLSGGGPIDVTAESQARVSTNPDHWVLKGNVEAIQGQARLRSPQIDLFYPPRGQTGATTPRPAAAGLGRIERIEAEGPVYYVTPTQAAKGDHGTYLAADDSITLTGNVVLTQGKSVSTGDRVVMHQKTGEAVLTSGKGKRTRGVFYPNEPAPAGAPAPRRAPRGPERRAPARIPAMKLKPLGGPALQPLSPPPAPRGPERPAERAAEPGAPERAALRRDDLQPLGPRPARAAEPASPTVKAPRAVPAEGLQVDRIGKSFRGRAVVKSVSLSLRRGEVAGLLGPNGAGKTTCFYMITGLIAADYGSIWLDGGEITALPMFQRARLGVGYLPQETSIFRGMSVEENVQAVVELREPDPARQRRRVDELLEELRIAHLRSSPASALSGGERRRCEIARALASEPAFMLLDEPFAGIDPLAITDIREVIRYLADRGIGVLITDHNVRETLDIIERASIIHGGEVLFEGRPDEILADPEVRRVYLGDRFG